MIAYQIKFSILNPSIPQTAPGMNVTVNYYTTDKIAVQWANAAVQTIDYSNGISVVGMTGLNFGDDIQLYPMHIREAIITSSIRQSSPFPCDFNTIVVTVSADIDLHPLCVPRIRLAGLTGSATGDSTTFPVALEYGNTTRISTGTWDQGNGSLVVAHPSETRTISKNTAVVVRFNLTNPNVAQPSPITSLAVVLQDAFHDPTAHTVASMGLPADESSLEDTAWNSLTACSKASGDAQPLQIRALAFNASSSIASNDLGPCAPNIITVTLKTTGPVFTSCVSKFTLSGMNDTATADSTSLALSGTAITNNVFEATGGWTQNTGTLVVTLQNSFVRGCVDQVFSFSLENLKVERDQVSGVSISTGNPELFLAESASIDGVLSVKCALQHGAVLFFVHRLSTRAQHVAS